MKTKLELTPEEVKEAVKHYVALTYGPCRTTVELNVAEVWSGYGMYERQTTEFTGATVIVEKTYGTSIS